MREWPASDRIASEPVSSPMAALAAVSPAEAAIDTSAAFSFSFIGSAPVPWLPASDHDRAGSNLARELTRTYSERRFRHLAGSLSLMANERRRGGPPGGCLSPVPL